MEKMRGHRPNCSSSCRTFRITELPGLGRRDTAISSAYPTPSSYFCNTTPIPARRADILQLALNEFAVALTRNEQLLVSSAFHDAPSLYHDNKVSLLNRAHPVRNRNDRTL
jgi:hypothetical protein